MRATFGETLRQHISQDSIFAADAESGVRRREKISCWELQLFPSFEIKNWIMNWIDWLFFDSHILRRAHNQSTNMVTSSLPCPHDTNARCLFVAPYACVHTFHLTDPSRLKSLSVFQSRVMKTWFRFSGIAVRCLLVVVNGLSCLLRLSINLVL